MFSSLIFTKMARANHRLRHIERCFSYTSKPGGAVPPGQTGQVVKSEVGGGRIKSGPTTRHLATGDVLPEQQHSETLRLFSMKYCPYALRARLVLAAKGVEYETVNCNLKYKPEFLLERNPKGLVPVLEMKGQVICESTIICDLLDELYPQRPLYPTDPLSKARDKLTMDFFNSTVTKLLYKISRNKGDDPDLPNKFASAVKHMEEDLAARGTPCFSGQEPGMVDYICWPWFERMSRNRLANELLLSFPLLSNYFHRMRDDKAVKEIYIPPEEFDRFYQGLFSGNPVYDL